MEITIIGAGGDVGREVARLIVHERLLACDQRLILVGNPQGSSAHSTFGVAADLMDAYAEVCPQIEVVLDPDRIAGGLIIMAAGATMPVDSWQSPSDEERVTRGLLAQRNLSVFRRYAQAIAENGDGSEIVICISNPNELAVAVLAQALGRERVIGMGAFLDSLRFRQEIAADLGVRRQDVHAFMLGEHGANLVPIWTDVHIFGYDDERLARAIHGMRQGHTTADFMNDVHNARGHVSALIARNKIPEAYEYVDTYPPDVRIAIKPFITHFSGSKTVAGTAQATLEMIKMITLGHDTLIAGQTRVEGEFHGVHSTIGVPFIVGNRGVERVVEIPLSEEERQLLCSAAENVQHKIEGWIEGA